MLKTDRQNELYIWGNPTAISSGKIDESMTDKRMYATGETNCPVEMLRLLIKTCSYGKEIIQQGLR